MEFINLTIDEVLEIHDDIIQFYGGGLNGIRDKSLLLSALNKPYEFYFDYELYRTIEEKISSIVHSIICFHVFVDANKRTGVAVLCILLEMNEIYINYTQHELSDLGVGIANKKYDVHDISNWIIEHKINR